MKAALVSLTFLAISGCTATPRSSPPPSAPPAVAPVSSESIHWRDWSNEAFAEAKAAKKLVLLDLGTGWCHWCHVMDETTYKDPAVVKLVTEHFVALRVDADARLDLANRYEDYGWPATIVFDGAGTELIKFRGFIPAARLASLLQGAVDDPTPGPSARAEATVAAASSSALAEPLRALLLERFEKGYDAELGGWGKVHKFVDLDAIELCMRLAKRTDREGSVAWSERAQKTLEAERTHLIDPIWGGAYQYSDSGVWVNPHFEKIMSRQAADLIAFSLAYAEGHDPKLLAAARDIERYLAGLLTSPEGTFYSNQDADLVKGEHSAEYFALDDAARRKQGVPAIDTHVYARENGWAIEGLVALHAASGDAKTLARAVTAAEKILASHSVAGGGFTHAAGDKELYLADTLAMGSALLRLHQATGERRFLDRSSEAARFVARSFATENGFAAASVAASDATGPAAPRPDLGENVAVARWMALLHAVTGDASFREQAERAMRYVAAPAATARQAFYVGGPLLADLELREEPLHITISGDGDDARALVRAALALPTRHLVIERDPKGEPASALLCGRGVCKPPVHDAEALTRVALALDRGP